MRNIRLRERKVQQRPLVWKTVTKNVSEHTPHGGLIGGSDDTHRSVPTGTQDAAYFHQRVRRIREKLKPELAHHSVEDMGFEGQGVSIRSDCTETRVRNPRTCAGKHCL